jgi:hypothetical protein
MQDVRVLGQDMAGGNVQAHQSDIRKFEQMSFVIEARAIVHGAVVQA